MPSPRIPTASLNHPHIAAIYGVEESDGVRALVLELVDGPTLARRRGNRNARGAAGQRDRAENRGLTVRVWRIARAAHAGFDGEGARRYGSRWTRKGLPLVFTSATLSLAELERFVHADPDLEPLDLVAIAVDIDPGIAVTTVDTDDLPAGWRAYPAPPCSRYRPW